MSNRKITKDVSDSVIAGAILASFPLNKQDRIIEYKDASNVTIKGLNLIPLRIGEYWFFLDTDTDVSTTTDMDTGSVAAGKDYYIYACDNSGNLVFKISLSSSYPYGFDANNSRKIGGFHTLCASVGVISGHPLSEASANDILQYSVWDLKHRPLSEPEGMVWSSKAGIWVDIYLTSGTGVLTASVNGGTISDSQNWMDFVDDFAAVKKQMLCDSEFQIIAAGSNEETNISGSADPVTTGGHIDTAGRRMVSDIGCEDCCGVLWQWLLDQSWRADGLPDTGDPTWSWLNLAGDKGSLYKQGTYGDVKLLAGANWSRAENSGSRSRYATSYRWHTYSYIGGRGMSRPQ